MLLSPEGARYPLQLGGLEKCEPGALHTTTSVVLHSPVNTAKSRQVKFLAQSSKSLCQAPDLEFLNTRSTCQPLNYCSG